MKVRGLSLYVLSAVLLTGGPTAAAEPADLMRAFLEAEISNWVRDPALVDAVRAQNALHANLTQTEIDALDLQWRAEVGAAQTPMITPVVENAVSDMLRVRVAATSGVAVEAFVMDARGMNVAASDPTSDYWQGDEDKFTTTFGVGPDAMHLGEIEFDESTQTYVGQASMVVTDPDSGAPIGAITVSLDASLLN